jgi:hypothetical protein
MHYFKDNCLDANCLAKNFDFQKYIPTLHWRLPASAYTDLYVLHDFIRFRFVGVAEVFGEFVRQG